MVVYICVQNLKIPERNGVGAGRGGGLCEILSVVGVRIDVFSGTTNCNENVGKSQKVKKKTQ